MKYFYELQIELGRRARIEFYIQQLGKKDDNSGRSLFFNQYVNPGPG